MRFQLIKGLVTASVLLGLAAFSPAPIRDPESGKHEIGEHSAAQRKADMKYNGTTGVVGTVPVKTNADGTGVDPIQGDATAKTNIAAAPLANDKNAVQTLSVATKKLEDEKAQEAKNPWMTGLIIFVSVLAAFQGLKWWLEKNGPAPKARVSRPAANQQKITVIDEDEAWA
jgi:hypothetical protein